MKRKAQKLIESQLPRIRLQTPIYIEYAFFCPNAKKDLDNISGFFHKVFQDAMVERGLIPDDGWRHIKGYSDRFFIDRGNPRVEIEFREVEGLSLL